MHYGKYSMMIKNYPKPFLIGLAIIINLLITYCLTSRYFPIEPDAANSPLVWRDFTSHGLSAFKDWVPTPDNWYFTTYPVNFVFFLITNSDVKLPLVMSTSFFVSGASILFAAAIYSVNKSFLASLLTLTSLAFLPAYIYTYGFAAHPFSHYSTNFFGALVFSLALLNLRKRSLHLTYLYSFIAILVSTSDPWFLATYFLPLLLTLFYLTYKNRALKKHSFVCLVAFIISVLHLPQKALNLPIQRFKLAPLDQWLTNAEWTYNILGKSLNLLIIDNTASHAISLIVWISIFTYSLITCFGKGRRTDFVCLFSFLSIAGIISSFIISYDAPADISARFFVNAVCFFALMAALRISFSVKAPIILAFILFITTSSCSYYNNTTPLYDQENQTYDFMAFLKQNNLSFGYGDYWKFSNTVNWLSSGEIHITPVLFDTQTYRVDLKNHRSQTMKSWLDMDYIGKAPNRQFIIIPTIRNNEADIYHNPQLQAITGQFGNPDEILDYSGVTIFIYNHKIIEQ